MADVAIITAIYDRYDDLKPVLAQEGPDVDWVLVTDDQGIPDGHLGWRVVYQPKPGQNPRRASKQPKFCPWEYTDIPASVYIDASVRVLSPRFASEALALAGPIAQFVHPWRDCIFEEAEFSAGIPRHSWEPVREQAAHYRAAGHPAHWGLWATTVIARRHTPDVIQLGNAWAAETDMWTLQCQVSQPYVLRNQGLRPASLPGDHLNNPWLSWEGSSRH